MLDRDFTANTNKIFTDLLDLANKELNSSGFSVEPSVIVGKIISPLRDVYLKNLVELLQSAQEKEPPE